MAIFAIIQQPGGLNDKLGPAIVEKFPNANLQIGSGTWLIYGPGTAQEASNALGVTPGIDVGSAIVIEVASYYGRANPEIWSFIKNNWESKVSG